MTEPDLEQIRALVKRELHIETAALVACFQEVSNEIRSVIGPLEGDMALDLRQDLADLDSYMVGKGPWLKLPLGRARSWLLRAIAAEEAAADQ